MKSFLNYLDDFPSFDFKNETHTFLVNVYINFFPVIVWWTHYIEEKFYEHLNTNHYDIYIVTEFWLEDKEHNVRKDEAVKTSITCTNFSTYAHNTELHNEALLINQAEANVNTP